MVETRRNKKYNERDNREEMKTRDFEKSVYNKNKKLWHERHRGELHHARGRIGLNLCCLALFTAAEFCHHDNIPFIKLCKEMFRETEILAWGNYIKGLGCKKEIFEVCGDCAMPKGV